jgi:hypothetical protein
MQPCFPAVLLGWFSLGRRSGSLFIFAGTELSYPDKIVAALVERRGWRWNWRHVVACEAAMLAAAVFGCWLFDRRPFWENAFWMGVGTLFRPVFALAKNLCGLDEE